MDSDTSLNMMSQNELTFGGKIPSEDRKNPPSSRQRKGRVDGRRECTLTMSMSMSQRCCWNIHRHHLWVYFAEKWETPTSGKKGESLIEDGQVSRCKSENHVQKHKNSVCPMTLRWRRAADCTLQVPPHQVAKSSSIRCPKARRTQGRHPSGDRMHFPGVQARRDDFNLSKKDSLLNPPGSHKVVVEQPTVEPKEKTPDDMRVSSEERSTDVPVQETKHKQANWQAQCFFCTSSRSGL